MPGEAYFLAFGALGLSLAGFAGLIAALNPRSTSRLLLGYRVRAMVFLGFSDLFVGFGTVALYAVTGGDLTLTVRLGTVLMAVPFLRGLLVEMRPGPVWSGQEAQRRVSLAIILALLGATAANLVVANVVYLQALLCFSLLGPVSIFYNTIRDATDPDLVADAEPPDRQALSG